MRRALLSAAFIALTGCDSPEASRVRGGGPGADTGNRGAELLMHEGSKPYYKTPDLIPAEAPSLAPARQAHQLSLQ